MSSKSTRPVWPTVLYTTSLLAGFQYGSMKQQAYVAKAEAQIEDEQKLIQKYREIYKGEQERIKAEASGEDISIYHLPKGMRQLAKSFKSTHL